MLECWRPLHQPCRPNHRPVTPRAACRQVSQAPLQACAQKEEVWHRSLLRPSLRPGQESSSSYSLLPPSLHAPPPSLSAASLGEVPGRAPSLSATKPVRSRSRSPEGAPTRLSPRAVATDDAQPMAITDSEDATSDSQRGASSDSQPCWEEEKESSPQSGTQGGLAYLGANIWS